MTVLAVIGARLNSSRLPRKHMLDLAGKPLIARIFERLERVSVIDKVVLATTADDYNKPLVNWAEQAGKSVLAWQGDVDDVMARVDAVVTREKPEMLVYICGDCPLIEPGFIEKIIVALRTNPEAERITVAENPGPIIHQGIDIYPIKFWQKVLANSTRDHEREHVGSAMRRMPLNRFEIVDDEVFGQLQHRISVDTPSDYRFMSEIYLRWYAEHDEDTIVSLPWVIECLQAEPELRAINAEVRQKGLLDHSLPVLMITAADKQIGWGHLSRTMVAARALQDQLAAGVRLLIQGERLARPGLALLPHRFVEDLVTGIEAALRAKAPHVVVLDLPKGLITDRLKTLVADLNARGIKLVVIDPTPGLNELAHLVWVPSFYCRPEDKHHENLFHGWGCYLLDKSIRERWESGKNVVVLTGGADHYGLGKVWPAQLDETLPSLTRIYWVQGPYAQAPDLPDTPKLNWKVLRNPGNLDEIIGGCHYALTVYGVSFFECLAYGLPTVTVAPNRPLDDGEWQSLIAEEVAVTASVDDGVATLKRLMDDSDEARVLADRCTMKLDGKGARRLAERIAGLV